MCKYDGYYLDGYCLDGYRLDSYRLGSAAPRAISVREKANRSRAAPGTTPVCELRKGFPAEVKAVVRRSVGTVRYQLTLENGKRGNRVGERVLLIDRKFARLLHNHLARTAQQTHERLVRKVPVRDVLVLGNDNADKICERLKLTRASVEEKKS